MKKKKDFRFRWQPSEETNDYYLLGYFQGRPETVRELFLETNRVHWGAIACHESGECPREETVRMGLVAIGALRAQIRYIKDRLALVEEGITDVSPSVLADCTGTLTEDGNDPTTEGYSDTAFD